MNRLDQLTDAERARQDRAAAEALAVALRELLSELPRCQEPGCKRPAQVSADYVSHEPTHCEEHCPVRGRACDWDTDAAEAALAAWEARGR